MLILGENCLKIGSGATPRGGKEVYSSDGPIALIRSQNIYNDGFNFNGLARISTEQAKNLENVEIFINDILLNITGDSVARTCIVDQNALPARVNQHVAIIRTNPKKINPFFLRYYLITPTIQNHLLALSSAGATRNALTKAMIESLLIPNYNLYKQRTIASILAILDDKINLNRRTNETLEAMARALFRDWFVDFGPTRAKMAGEAPYLAPELWELFPDRLDDEGKPEGWQSLPLADLAILSKSSINPAQFSDEDFLHFSLPAFDKGMMPDLVKGEEIKSGKFSLPSNSILLSKLNPETPRVWMVTAHEESYQRICSTEFMVLNPLQKNWLALIYCACLSQPFRETLQGMVTGTSKSHQRVQPLAVMQTHLLHATDILMRQFGLTAQPLLAKINFNRNESSTLAQLRDLLLPKLMSGEISIRDAEKMVEDAA
ncbi:restriction endonuclease subunit S [Acetobacter sicerae]|uniref:restriction endonuclease subunit S n=1 Tax=Acetobacter sicerae TaxID=85325 RepID=UPI00156BCF45|nr:restriction endonuclease subunit S [Acetobacter sicerae]NHN93677.1 restriction endonuclease subunit S [Acetobacter sicerae]